MLAIFGFLLIGVVISLFEIPPLVKKQWWREMIVFCTLLVTGLTLSILLSKNLPIPNPTEYITEFYHPAARFIERILS